MGIQRYNHYVETEYPWYSSMSDDPHGNYVLYSNYETVIATKDAEIAALRAQMEKADALAEDIIDGCRGCADKCHRCLLGEARLKVDSYKEARHG